MDLNGHLFIWKYEKQTITSKQVFEPAGKFRIALNYHKFIRVGEKKIFPESGKDLDPSKPIKDAKVL